MICNKSYNAYTTPLFYTLKQLKIAVKFSLCKILFKVFHNELSNNIQMLFSTVQTIHSYLQDSKITCLKNQFELM